MRRGTSAACSDVMVDLFLGPRRSQAFLAIVRA